MKLEDGNRIKVLRYQHVLHLGMVNRNSVSPSPINTSLRPSRVSILPAQKDPISPKSVGASSSRFSASAGKQQKVLHHHNHTHIHNSTGKTR